MYECVLSLKSAGQIYAIQITQQKKKRLESREEEKSVFLLLYAARELTRMREIM